MMHWITLNTFFSILRLNNLRKGKACMGKNGVVEAFINVMKDTTPLAL